MKKLVLTIVALVTVATSSFAQFSSSELQMIEKVVNEAHSSSSVPSVSYNSPSVTYINPCTVNYNTTTVSGYTRSNGTYVQSQLVIQSIKVLVAVSTITTAEATRLMFPSVPCGKYYE